MRLSLRYITPATLFLLMAVNASADNYYKWIDEEGITHYSETPPKNTKSTQGKTQTGHSAPSTYTPSETQTDPHSNTSDQQLTKDPERCKAAKSNLDIINTSSRIKVKGDDGEFSYLSPEAVAKRKKEAQQAVKESC